MKIKLKKSNKINRVFNRSSKNRLLPILNSRHYISSSSFKSLISVTSFLILLSPLSSYAIDVVTEHAKPCPNSSPAKSGYKELFISLLGLSKCLDPNTTPREKFLYCSRPCFLVSALTAGYIAEKFPVNHKGHKIASICCASSWIVYSSLLCFGPKTQEVPKK